MGGETSVCPEKKWKRLGNLNSYGPSLRVLNTHKSSLRVDKTSSRDVNLLFPRPTVLCSQILSSPLWQTLTPHPPFPLPQKIVRWFPLHHSGSPNSFTCVHFWSLPHPRAQNDNQVLWTSILPALPSCPNQRCSSFQLIFFSWTSSYFLLPLVPGND